MEWLVKEEPPPTYVDASRATPEKRRPSRRQTPKKGQAPVTDGILPAFVGMQPGVVRRVADVVRVLPSPLHGFGIFAAVPLRRGTVVGQYQGTMSRECPDDRTFVMRVDFTSMRVTPSSRTSLVILTIPALCVMEIVSLSRTIYSSRW